MSVYRLYIFSSNDKGKQMKEMFILDSMTDVARSLITYKPKRGYFVTGFEGEQI
jgi:hypothetical protein